MCVSQLKQLISLAGTETMKKKRCCSRRVGARLELSSFEELGGVMTTLLKSCSSRGLKHGDTFAVCASFEVSKQSSVPREVTAWETVLVRHPLEIKITLHEQPGRARVGAGACFSRFSPLLGVTPTLEHWVLLVSIRNPSRAVQQATTSTEMITSASQACTCACAWRG